MSEKNPTEVEKRELMFVCQRCGAEAGDWCHHWKKTSVFGPLAVSASRVVPYLHRERFNSATLAGLLPL